MVTNQFETSLMDCLIIVCQLIVVGAQFQFLNDLQSMRIFMREDLPKTIQLI